MKILIIANNRYAHGGYPDLPGVLGDIELWARWAQRRNVLTDVSVIRNVTRSDLLALDLHDTDLVVYSGHGVQTIMNGAKHEGIATIEKGRLRVLWDNELPLVQGHDKPLWFLDCCHAGGIEDAVSPVPYATTRSIATLGAPRTLGCVDLSEVNAPSASRSLFTTTIRSVSTARKEQLASEVLVSGKPYGLGTYVVHHISEDSPSLLSREHVMGVMVALGGRRASQPAGEHWHELQQLVTGELHAPAVSVPEHQETTLRT